MNSRFIKRQRLSVYVRGLVCMVSVLAALVGTHARAEPQSAPKVLAVYLEHRLNDTGTGGYNRLLTEIMQNGLAFDVSILPLKRWHKKSKANTTACFFPVTVNAMATYDESFKKMKFVASEPVDHVSMRVFTAPGKALIRNLDQLKGKRVAAWKSRDSAPYLQTLAVQLDESRDETSQLQLLYASRVDAIIGFTPDIDIAAKQLNVPTPQFDKGLALFNKEPAALVCHDTPSNQEFVRQFNRQLRGLRKTGALQDILGQYATLAY